MKKQKCPSYRPAQRFHLHWTEMGRILCMGSIFTLITSLVIPAYGALAALLALQAVALCVGSIYRPHLEIQGVWPERTTVGKTQAVRFTIRNLSRLPIHHLQLAVQTFNTNLEIGTVSGPMLSLDPGAQCHVTFSLKAQRRGQFHLPFPVAFSTWPFHLYRFGVRRETSHTLLVQPRTVTIDIQNRQTFQGVNRPNALFQILQGYSPEYLGNRPFVPGDAPHRIDARAWARLGSPAIKEFHEETQHPIGIVLDPWMGPTRQWTDVHRATREAAISLAASVARELQQSVLLDRLLVGSRYVPLGPGSAAQRTNDLYDQLAMIPDNLPALEGTALDIGLQGLRTLDTLFFITTTWHQAGQQLIEQAERDGCNCVLLRVSDDPNQRAPVHTNSLPWPKGFCTITPQAIQQEQVTLW